MRGAKWQWWWRSYISIYGHLSFLKNRFAGFSWASAADCGDLSDPKTSREDFQRIKRMSFRISIHVFVCSQVLKDRRWLRSQPRQHAWGVLPESWGRPATFEWWCAQDAPPGNGIPESNAEENPVQQQLSWSGMAQLEKRTEKVSGTDRSPLFQQESYPKHPAPMRHSMQQRGCFVVQKMGQGMKACALQYECLLKECESVFLLLFVSTSQKLDWSILIVFLVLWRLIFF